MYTLPREYVCPLGHSMQYSPSLDYRTPTFMVDYVSTGDGKTYKSRAPVCPVCYEKFILSHVPIMVRA